MNSKHNRTLPVDEFIQKNDNPREKTITEETREAPVFLPNDVVRYDLSKTSTHQLEGRLNYYEREALFERNPRTRRECQHEIERTRKELERRKLAIRAEAEQIFRDEALSSSLKV